MTSFLDALEEKLQAASAYAKDDQVAPAAVLWPDAERQWEPLIPLLRERLPLLTLGDYDPGTRTGPSYWIRCMLERTIAEDVIPAGETPVIYLPGVSKQEIRAIEEAPQLLKPLAELQYRGTLFYHGNGRDWTIAGFLQSSTESGGLGIETSADAGTKAAILGARGILAELSVEEMRRSAPLRASFFNNKLQPDLTRNVLEWLNHPGLYRATVSEEEWEAFRALCRSTFNLDPHDAGPAAMATELGLGQSDGWELAWQRFAEAPEKYPGIPERLRVGRPKQRKGAGGTPQLWAKVGRWPQENDEAEAALREALNDLKDAQPTDARSRLGELEQEHGPRREWVWSQLGEAPLAHALEHLAAAAKGSHSQHLRIVAGALCKSLPGGG